MSESHAYNRDCLEAMREFCSYGEDRNVPTNGGSHENRPY